MTKEAYFEMCEALGTEPVDSEIPLDFNDFPVEVQEAFGIYNMLRDDWDGMSGTYMGKHLEGIKDLFEILDVPVEDYKTMLTLVKMIDSYRSKTLAATQKAKRDVKDIKK